MYFVFKDDGTFEQTEEWPRSHVLKRGECQYVLQQEANRAIWYLNRLHIGPMGINLSDVPPQYIKIVQMLNLILPKE